MTYLVIAAGVAVAALLAETFTVIYFSRAQRSLVRQYGRERELLVNQICNLAGRPWQMAPADEAEPYESEPVLIGSPEQLPDW